LQVFVEGTDGRGWLQKSEGGFMFALLGQFRSQQRNGRGMDLGEPVAMLLCPLRVLIFGEQWPVQSANAICRSVRSLLLRALAAASSNASTSTSSRPPGQRRITSSWSAMDAVPIMRRTLCRI
jgi:hypothetical protein